MPRSGKYPHDARGYILWINKNGRKIDDQTHTADKRPGIKKLFGSESCKDILRGIIGDFFDVWPGIDDITISSSYSIETYKEILKKADGKEEAIAKLRQTIKDVSADFKNLEPEEREMINQLEESQEIYKSTIYTAYLEGRTEGRTEERRDIARNALQMGMAIADISRLTGIDGEEIRKLIH